MMITSSSIGFISAAVALEMLRDMQKRFNWILMLVSQINNAKIAIIATAWSFGWNQPWARNNDAY